MLQHDLIDGVISYSQHGQDLWVVDTLAKATGFFLEMGACDGVFLSNTLALEKLGWCGICVEPSQLFATRLYENRRCFCDNSLVAGKHRTTATFCDSADGLAGVDGLRQHGGSWTPVTLTTSRLIDILQRYQAPRHIDYFSLDVEGAELEILDDFPYTDYSVALWTIEHNAETFPSRAPIRDEIIGRLTRERYIHVADRHDDALFCLPGLEMRAREVARRLWSA